jgi:hypothetical protein
MADAIFGTDVEQRHSHSPASALSASSNSTMPQPGSFIGRPGAVGSVIVLGRRPCPFSGSRLAARSPAGDAGIHVPGSWSFVSWWIEKPAGSGGQVPVPEVLVGADDASVQVPGPVPPRAPCAGDARWFAVRRAPVSPPPKTPGTATVSRPKYRRHEPRSGGNRKVGEPAKSRVLQRFDPFFTPPPPPVPGVQDRQAVARCVGEEHGDAVLVGVKQARLRPRVQGLGLQLVRGSRRVLAAERVLAPID